MYLYPTRRGDEPGAGPNYREAIKRAARAAPINGLSDRRSGGVHQIFKLGRCRFLIDFLDSSEFAGQSLKSGLIHLTLGIGLL